VVILCNFVYMKQEIYVIETDVSVHLARSLSRLQKVVCDEAKLKPRHKPLFIFNFVTLIMAAQDAPKRRFLSLIFLVSCISKSFLIRILSTFL